MTRANAKDPEDTTGKPVFAFGSLLSVVLIGLLVYQLWPSEERAIRRRLDALAATLSAPGGEGGIAMVTRVAELRSYFAPEVRIRLGRQEVVSREALLALMSRWNPAAEGFAVDFVDINVNVGEDATAKVYLTATVSRRDARTGQQTIDAREANLTMAKRDGDWVLTEVESAETLERP